MVSNAFQIAVPHDTPPPLGPLLDHLLRDLPGSSGIPIKKRWEGMWEVSESEEGDPTTEFADTAAKVLLYIDEETNRRRFERKKERYLINSFVGDEVMATMKRHTVLLLCDLSGS
jgi:hypothetical protein